MFWALYGLGRSTMLRAMQKERGGIVIDMAFYLERLTEAEPLALEDDVLATELKIKPKRAS